MSVIVIGDAEEWFTIKNRGPVAVIKQLPEGMYDPDQLKNKKVMIDGHEYKVIGVESFSILRSPESPYQLSFGLLVES